MTPSELLKVLAQGWPLVRFSNYAEWQWVHEELGPTAREYVDPDGEWVIFIDGAFLYLGDEKGYTIYRVGEEIRRLLAQPVMKVGCERPDGTLNIHGAHRTCEVCEGE